MIARYTRPDMGALWTDERKYDTWLEVELLICEALADLKKIPKDAAKQLREKASVDAHRIAEIEETTRHDVIAFTTAVGETVGDLSRYIHMGVTSSDVVDTAFAYLLREATKKLLKDIDALLEVLKEQAFKYKDQVMMGRSHGIHAEPVTLGLKFALWYSEFERNKARLKAAQKTISVGKISGAVGTFAHIPMEVEEKVCKKLGLTPASVSTQIVQRDRHAELFATIAIIGASVEKVAVELRHLQRTEVREVEEGFGEGQKGSSAMPHKKNPVSGENLTGLARVLRANAHAALENVALWHERDISHSSVERIIGPDSTILLDYMLARLTTLVSALEVYPDAMEKNIELTRGLIFSQTVLLALVDKGVSREDAYAMVQRNAMKVWDNPKLNLADQLIDDKEVVKLLGQREIYRCFNPQIHVRHVDDIFGRVFGAKEVAERQTGWKSRSMKGRRK